VKNADLKKGVTVKLVTGSTAHVEILKEGGD
jgi:hypothetical protein